MPLLDQTVVDSASGTDEVEGLNGNGRDCLEDDYLRKLELRKEEVRLKTFKDWPKTIPVKPEDLAADGFFYLERGDRAKCIFCNLILKGWEPGDIVRHEHERFMPTCPFITGQHVNNVPIVRVQQEMRGRSRAPPSPRVPRHPLYGSEQSRFETFKDWPKAAEINPRELARAGFFYAGHSDSVTCFHCGGNLRNWEPGDNPWSEHRDWFPMCHFLKTHAPTIEITPVIQRALDMGYDKQDVQSAVEERRKRGAGEFEDMNSLIDAIEKLKAQENQEQGPNVVSTREATPSTSMGHEGAQGGAAAGPSSICSSGASSLEDEYRQMKDQRLCKICMDKEVEITFIPCGHLVTCATCGHRLSECPICRTRIKGSVRTYMS